MQLSFFDLIGGGGGGQNSLLIHVPLKGNQRMQRHGGKHFACRLPPTPLTLRMGTEGKFPTFSEHGHVAYRTKWNHESMQQNGSKYFATPSPPLGLKAKFQLFKTL